MVNPIQAGFRSIPKSIFEAALTLGKGPLEILWRILLPNIKHSVLIGIIMAFAHTIGEFGVVMMIGGNIAGGNKGGKYCDL